MWLTLPGHSLSQKKVRTESPAVLEAETGVSGSCSAHFLIQPRCIAAWAFLHEPSTKTICHRQRGHRPLRSGNSSIEVPSFKMTLGCVKLTNKTNQLKGFKAPGRIDRNTGSDLWFRKLPAARRETHWGKYFGRVEVWHLMPAMICSDTNQYAALLNKQAISRVIGKLNVFLTQTLPQQ